MLSVKDLEERNRNKKMVKKELCTRILTQLCRKIDLNHTLGKTECSLVIPEYIFGYPTFDMYSMTMYMHRQLLHLGYRTSIIQPGVLYVAWGKKKKKQVKVVEDDDNELPSLANLKKAADSLRKKYYTEHTK